MINLVCHLGLGDAIILSGAAVYLSEHSGEELRFPCWRKNEENVKSFFVDNPNIQVRPIDYEKDMFKTSGFLCGYYDTMEMPQLGESFDKWFYRQLGVPFEERWKSSPIREASKKVKQITLPPKPYVFLHEDRLRGYSIDTHTRIDSKLAFTPVHPGILQYADMIENAEEVHVIPSCFKELTSQLNPKGKLFLHRYARPIDPIFDMTQSPHHWEILD